jgi:hypothetical protein
MKFFIYILSFAFAAAILFELAFDKTLRRKSLKEKALTAKEKALAIKEKAEAVIKENIDKTAKSLQKIADIGTWKIREDFKVLH